MLFLDPIDLAKLEIRNVCLQALAGDPAAPGLGQLYFNTADGLPHVWDGAAWITLGAAGGGSGSGTVTSFSAGNLAPLFTTAVATDTTTPALTFTLTAQAAHSVLAGPTSGAAAAPTFRVLVAADISDFDAQVRSSRLDQMAAPTAALGLGGQRITNLAAPTGGTDAATKNYVDASVQGLTQKPTARAATAAALPANTYGNGAAGVGATLTANANGALSIDGVAVAAGDVVLVKNEGAAANNGVYAVTQPGTGATPYILTRHPDMDTAAEFPGAFVPVDNEGATHANSLWLAAAVAGGVVVGTTAVTFTELNKAADLVAGAGITLTGNTIAVTAGYAVRKYSALIGDGATTALAIPQATHGLAANGQMHVAVYDAASGALVMPDVSINNGTGTVTITFAVAPAANAYRVVILG